jgi:Cupin domain
MKVNAAVPAGPVGGWRESPKELPGPQTIGPHYHDVEEWLTVVSGEITFFTLAAEPFRVDVGRSLHIPRGEVHHVKVGPQGVEYRMFVPIAEPMSVNVLTGKEVIALRQNLEFPDYEDGRVENGLQFFESALSDQLLFCRANGKWDNKEEFLAPFLTNTTDNKDRSSSGSIKVLKKSENGLLISTIVQVGKAEQAKWYMNVRFLEKEGGKLRCRFWVNYEQPESNINDDAGRWLLRIIRQATGRQ